jgi:uncharacterized protein (DUF885 family)
LNRLVERYWDERADPDAALSVQSLADSLAVERRFLADILAIPRAPLDEESKLTYDIFRRRLELDIEGFTYPAELLPVEPFDGMPLQLARAAAAVGGRPFSTARDYENWLSRIDRYVGWSHQAIANMREGMRRGYTSPRVLMERMLPVLQGFGEDKSGNVFYTPLRTMPDAIKEPDRSRLSAALGSATKDRLLPAYREMHDFIRDEYIPRARASIALSALPLGPTWYAYRVRRATDTKLTAIEIHAIGSAEVERIRAQMQAPAVGPAAASQGLGAAELLSAYADLKQRTLAALPSAFSALPQADFEIRAFVPPQDPSARLEYQAAMPGSKIPAVLFVNTSPGAPGSAAPAIADFLQEAIPGRHLQAALQRERTDLPRLRRFGSEPAFDDGWALYAASLGGDMGLYPDEESKRAALEGQLKCAAALVVDTGLNAKGWTHQQAVDYLKAKLGLDDAQAGLSTDRFVAEPADALACKMGELDIQSLRRRAQQALGARFDLREFHAEILKDGAMPLGVLDAKMKVWMEAQH